MDEQRSPWKNFDERSFEMMMKYMSRIAKRIEGKPLATRAIMAHTFDTALVVLDCIRDAAPSEAIMSLFVFCKDADFLQYARKYESCLEVAILDPDRFIVGLHSFYNNLAAKLKSSGKMDEFFDFVGYFYQLRYFANEKINKNIIKIRRKTPSFRYGDISRSLRLEHPFALVPLLWYNKP